MASTLEQQTKRAEDPRFLAQVRAAILADTRDMNAGTGAWALDEEATKRGVGSQIRNLAARVIDDPHSIATKCARLVVSDESLPAPKKLDAIKGDDYTVADDVLIPAVRDALRAVIGI